MGFAQHSQLQGEMINTGGFKFDLHSQLQGEMINTGGYKFDLYSQLQGEMINTGGYKFDLAILAMYNTWIGFLCFSHVYTWYIVLYPPMASVCMQMMELLTAEVAQHMCLYTGSGTPGQVHR